MENDDKIVCGICLEEGEAVELPVKLPDCGHAFCFLCCKSWLENVGSSGGRCPICRTACSKPSYSFKLVEMEREKKEDGVRWEYAGRNGGYWLFSPACQEELELAWAKWAETEDSSDSNSELELTIGNYEYVIDFDEMIQYRKDRPNLKRDIRRVDGGSVVKGTAGLNDVFV